MLLLAFCSGACGIAYEVLYSRLLGTYLGHIYYVAGAILSCYLLMLGAGSFVAHRWRRYLWLIELLLGVYAVGLAFLCDGFQEFIITHVSPLAASPPRIFLCIFVVLALPAGLSGFSVPLFSSVVEDLEESRSGGAAFRWVYFLYNFGAALFVLLIEFVSLRRVGMRDTLLTMAGLNLLIGGFMWHIQRTERRQPFRDNAISPADERLPWVSLFLLGILSGAFQLLMLRMAAAVFGPFQENFALLVSLTLAAIAVGTAVIHGTRCGFSLFMLLGSLAVPASFLLIEPGVHLWALGNTVTGSSLLANQVLRGLVLGLIAGPGLLFFGATIPAATSGRAGVVPQVGALVGAASFGNFLGYLFTMLWWSDWLGDRGLALLVCVGVLAVSWFNCPSAGALRYLRLAPAALALLVVSAWPTTLLNVGYSLMRDPKTLRASVENVQAIEHYRKNGHHVGVVRDRDGTETLVLEGYSSLMVTPQKGPGLPEFLVGVAPAFFVADRSQSLVLGVGSGITAGAALHVFGHVDAVEINPAIMELLPHYAPVNNHIASHPRATLVLQDALTTLTTPGRKYNAIINTVTSPLYFSSGKLYTREFFQIVKRRLAPAGVYAFWFDARVGETGARVIVNTLKSSFTHCGFTLLRGRYVLVLCSDAPLNFDPSVPVQNKNDFETVYKTLGIPLTLAELVEGLSFTRHQVFERTWSEPLNTFDRPALEFEMSKLNLGSGKDFDLLGLLGIDPSRPGLGTNAVLDDQAFQRRILALQAQMELLAFQAFYQRYQSTNVPAAFFRNYGAYVRTTALSASTLCAHATSLVASGHFDETLQFLEAFGPSTPGENLPRLSVREREYTAWLRLVAFRQLNQRAPARELEEYCTSLAEALAPTVEETRRQIAQSVKTALTGPAPFPQCNLELNLLPSAAVHSTEPQDFALSGLAHILAFAATTNREPSLLYPETFRFPNRILYRRLLVECGPTDDCFRAQMLSNLARWGGGDYSSRALLRLCWLLGVGSAEPTPRLELTYPL